MCKWRDGFLVYQDGFDGIHQAQAAEKWIELGFNSSSVIPHIIIFSEIHMYIRELGGIIIGVRAVQQWNIDAHTLN